MLFVINNYWMVTLVNVSHSMKLVDCEKLDKWKLSDRTIDIVPVARIGIWNNMTINKSTRDGFKHLDIYSYICRMAWVQPGWYFHSKRRSMKRRGTQSK